MNKVNYSKNQDEIKNISGDAVRSLESERVVLGAALLEPDKVVPLLRDQLAVKDFYLRAHQLIFRAILDALDAGTPVESKALLFAVGNILEEREQLNEAGGRAYLTDLVSQACLSTSAPYYAERIKGAARRREVQAKLLEAYEKAKEDPDAALEELLTQAKLDQQASDQQPAGVGIGFPESTYIGIAGEFAQLYSQHVESPPQFLYMTFLTYLGAVLADKVTVVSELRPSPRLYTVLLGESATARKSAALDFVDRFFREVVNVNVHYGLGSAEGLAQELESDDGSPRSLLLHCDELKLLVDKAAQEGSVALPMLTTLFERTVFDNTTKGKKIRVRNGYLSLMAACTTETYQRMWHPSFRDIGFINRLFLVHGDAQRRFFSPKPVPEAERRRLQDELLELVGAITATVEARKRPLELVFEPEAERILQEWYLSLPDSVHTRRLETYGLRLCILLELSQGETKRITPQTALAVRDLLNYELAVRRLYDPIDADTLIAKVEESIRRVLDTYGPMTERDLKRRVNYQRVGVWVFNQALENLMHEKEVRFLSDKRRLALSEMSSTTHTQAHVDEKDEFESKERVSREDCHQKCHQGSEEGFFAD